MDEVEVEVEVESVVWPESSDRPGWLGRQEEHMVMLWHVWATFVGMLLGMFLVRIGML